MTVTENFLQTVGESIPYELGPWGAIADRCDILPLGGVDRDAWLKMRTFGMGGSDIGTIAGLNAYASTYSLWNEKTGRVIPEDAGEAAEWGNRLEDAVGAAYAERNDVAVIKWNVMLRSKDRPQALANVDFWISDSPIFKKGKVTEWVGSVEPPGIVAILETKTAGIATHGTAHKWNDNKIPDTYVTQVVHYGIVSGVHDCRFGALLAGRGLVCRQYEWTDEMAKNVVLLEDGFWFNNVVADIEPEPDGSKATEDAQKQRYPRSVEGKGYEGGDELLALWEDFEAKKVSAAAAEADRKAARAKIVSLVGDAEYATAGNVALFTFKSSKDGVKFDEAAFKKANPGEYALWLKEKPGHRTMNAVK
jgi:putative phage-type endonuclease